MEGEILKSDDSCISNPEIRNIGLDRPMCDFGFRDLRCRNRPISKFDTMPVMTKAMKCFIIAIAAMGVVRFILTVAGLPNDVVKYFSMTAIMTIGLIYFALVTPTHKGRLKAAYWLILPYMTIEVLALGYTWASGQQTIFHTVEYSFGTSIAVHTI